MTVAKFELFPTPKQLKQAGFFLALIVFIIRIAILINIYLLLTNLKTKWWLGAINASLAVTVKQFCISSIAVTEIFSKSDKLKNSMEEKHISDVSS